MKVVDIKIEEKYIHHLTQIAFGIMNISTNPDFFKMMEYAKKHGVSPNYTCHGLDMTPEYADKTAKLCGAVAVSLINKEKTYDTIKMLTDRGMNQINIHYMLSMETYDMAFKIIDDINNDERLKKFNAIVFLQYKDKNKNGQYNSIIDVMKYKILTDYCESKNVKYGFDSCSGPIFSESIENHPDKEMIEMFIEPCESGLFSSYINCHGKFFVCSFSENEDEWCEGIDVLNCKNFLEDVWNNPRLISWRKRLINNDRRCPIYDLNIQTQGAK